ncbi:hypothetical protein [Sorangium sp. So ce124]|uniref:hypothetical protein n=1 Tax=Sorangium sp. So ce124 TaxID=3133280 RepID=UPI003F5DA523
MSRRAIWQTVHERFDPAVPAELSAWRADRPLSPFENINKALDRPFGVPRMLLTGTVGTGKTTELLRIAEARSRKEFVVVINLERHFEQVVGDAAALQHISPWEVCFLAGVALLRSAEEQLGFSFPEIHLRALEQTWIKLAQSSDEIAQAPSIDIAKLAKSMVVLASRGAAGVVGGAAGAAIESGLSVLAAVADAGRWSLPFGRKKTSLPDQDAEVQTLLACVNVLIGLVQQHGSKVLLIIDGLDRIDSFERAKELFLDSQMISQLACRVVLCGPFILRQGGYMSNISGFSGVPPLVNVPVMLPDDPSRLGPGVPFFHALFARRVADLGAPGLVSPALLDRLAYYSGGRAREFVRFIRRLAELAWDVDAFAVTDTLVDKVLDEWRLVKESGLDVGQIRLLEAVVADPQHRLPEDRDKASTLLKINALLPYPNGSEWYYPHPLLTMRLLRTRPPGSTG